MHVSSDTSPSTGSAATPHRPPEIKSKVQKLNALAADQLASALAIASQRTLRSKRFTIPKPWQNLVEQARGTVRTGIFKPGDLVCDYLWEELQNLREQHKGNTKATPLLNEIAVYCAFAFGLVNESLTQFCPNRPLSNDDTNQPAPLQEGMISAAILYLNAVNRQLDNLEQRKDVQAFSKKFRAAGKMFTPLNIRTLSRQIGSDFGYKTNERLLRRRLTVMAQVLQLRPWELCNFSKTRREKLALLNNGAPQKIPEILSQLGECASSISFYQLCGALCSKTQTYRQHWDGALLKDSSRGDLSQAKGLLHHSLGMQWLIDSPHLSSFYVKSVLRGEYFTEQKYTPKLIRALFDELSELVTTIQRRGCTAAELADCQRKLGRWCKHLEQTVIKPFRTRFDRLSQTKPYQQAILLGDLWDAIRSVEKEHLTLFKAAIEAASKLDVDEAATKQRHELAHAGMLLENFICGAATRFLEFQPPVEKKRTTISPPRKGKAKQKKKRCHAKRYSRQLPSTKVYTTTQPKLKKSPSAVVKTVKQSSFYAALQKLDLKANPYLRTTLLHAMVTLNEVPSSGLPLADQLLVQLSTAHQLCETALKSALSQKNPAILDQTPTGSGRSLRNTHSLRTLATTCHSMGQAGLIASHWRSIECLDILHEAIAYPEHTLHRTQTESRQRRAVAKLVHELYFKPEQAEQRQSQAEDIVQQAMAFADQLVRGESIEDKTLSPDLQMLFTRPTPSCNLKEKKREKPSIRELPAAYNPPPVTLKSLKERAKVLTTLCHSIQFLQCMFDDGLGARTERNRALKNFDVHLNHALRLIRLEPKKRAAMPITAQFALLRHLHLSARELLLAAHAHFGLDVAEATEGVPTWIDNNLCRVDRFLRQRLFAKGLAEHPALRGLPDPLSKSPLSWLAWIRRPAGYPVTASDYKHPLATDLDTLQGLAFPFYEARQLGPIDHDTNIAVEGKTKNASTLLSQAEECIDRIDNHVLPVFDWLYALAASMGSNSSG